MAGSARGWRRRVALAVGALLISASLTSCSVPLPVFVRLESDGSLSAAGCFAVETITKASLSLTVPVVGDPKAFEALDVTFSGKGFNLAPQEAVTFPFVAIGWTSDLDYWDVANWHNASIAIAGSDGGLYTGNFGRANLADGEWHQVVGNEREDCAPPPD